MLGAFALLFILFAMFAKDVRIRYVAVAVPALVILSMFGARNLFQVCMQLPRGARGKVNWLAGCGITVTLLWCSGLYIWKQFSLVQPFEYIRGEVTRSQYIANYRKEYSAMKYMNENLEADAKVLFFFIGNRGYYCDRAYLFDMRGDQSHFQQIVAGSKDEAMVRLGVQELGISHLLINDTFFRRWVDQTFTRDERVIVHGFFKRYVEFVFVQSGYKVGRIREEGP
jgi:hypothetical protein